LKVIGFKVLGYWVWQTIVYYRFFNFLGLFF